MKRKRARPDDRHLARISLADALALHREARMAHLLRPSASTNGALNLAVLAIKKAVDDLGREVLRTKYAPVGVCRECGENAGPGTICRACLEARR